MSREQIHLLIYQALAISCICILPFSNALSSVSIILMAANWLAEGKSKSKLQALGRNWPAILMIVYFLWMTAGLLYTSDIPACQFSIQKKLSFLVLGVVFGSVRIFDKKNVVNFFYWFTFSLVLASTYCFFVAVFYYSQDHLTEHFFYHKLGDPIHFHAVYFSVWIFVALFFIVSQILSEERETKNKVQTANGEKTNPILAGLAIPRAPGSLLLVLFCWLSIFLILLSSKLVIITYLFCLTAVLLFNIKRFGTIKSLVIPSGLILIMTIGVLFTKNAISGRFDEVLVANKLPVGTNIPFSKTNLDSLSHINGAISWLDKNKSVLNNLDRFNSATYFDGVSLRLLFLRFGAEILTENHAWLTGVSGGDAQRLQNDKIKEANMYQGELGTTNQGYLNFNFHDQFMETTVQSGIPGLLILTALLVILIYTAVRNRDIHFFLFLLIFVSFFITESVWETQKGVVSFVLLALIFSSLYTKTKKTTRDFDFFTA